MSRAWIHKVPAAGIPREGVTATRLPSFLSSTVGSALESFRTIVPRPNKVPPDLMWSKPLPVSSTTRSSPPSRRISPLELMVTESACTSEALSPMNKLVPESTNSSRPSIVRSCVLVSKSIPADSARLRMEFELPRLTMWSVLKTTSSSASGSSAGVQLVVLPPSSQVALPPIQVRVAAGAKGESTATRPTARWIVRGGWKRRQAAALLGRNRCLGFITCRNLGCTPAAWTKKQIQPSGTMEIACKMSGRTVKRIPVKTRGHCPQTQGGPVDPQHRQDHRQGRLHGAAGQGGDGVISGSGGQTDAGAPGTLAGEAPKAPAIRFYSTRRR